MSEPIVMKCGCTSQSVITAIKGVKLDKPIPSCFIHECTEIADIKPDLTGRMARCGCGKKVPSSWSEAFFEFQGEGSREATLKCKCGYYEVAHNSTGRSSNCKCRKFVPKGTHEFDRFYCGCNGWD